jgi:MGT family glycosyltransferase
MPLSMRIMRDWQTLRLFMPSLIRDFAQGVKVNRLAQVLGEQYGVKPLGATEVLNARGDLSISYSSSYYVPHADTLPSSFRFVGWTMQESPSDEPFTHDSNHPLIYVSLGTVINDNARFYELCIKAFADTAYDVLISTGGRFSSEQFGTLPENITIKPWVSQSQVIQQSALFITHGGLNSLHDGLYCGLPLLVVPQQTEQTFNAMRVVDLGAGLMLKPDQLTISALQDSVTRLLTDGRYKAEARRISDTFRAGGGVVRAADDIEVVLRKHTGS